MSIPTLYYLKGVQEVDTSGVAIVEVDGTSHAGIDVVINEYSTEDVLQKLSGLTGRNHLNVMIHEQYFYKDYNAYQPDFKNKLEAVFLFLRDNGFKSCFFEDIIALFEVM